MPRKTDFGAFVSMIWVHRDTPQNNDLAVCIYCGDPYLLNSDLVNGLCAACAAHPTMIEFDEEGE